MKVKLAEEERQNLLDFLNYHKRLDPQKRKEFPDEERREIIRNLKQGEELSREQIETVESILFLESLIALQESDNTRLKKLKNLGDSLSIGEKVKIAELLHGEISENNGVNG